MAEVKIPADKDEIIALGKLVAEKAKTATKATGLKPPAKPLQQMKAGLKQAEKSLKLARDLRRRAELETKLADKGIKQMAKALRTIAQVLKHLADDPKVLGEFGFEVDESTSSTPPGGGTQK